MGNYTTEYRPNWTYGSPASKLSTYMSIARAARDIIKLITKQK